MGVSQSKNTTSEAVIQQKALDLTPQFTAPEGIVEKIKGLGEVITFFNDNDTTSLEAFIDKYNKQVSAKDQIDIGPEIKSMMMGFHNQLLEVIDGQLIGATSSEKEQVLKSKLKDNKQLNEMLRMYYNKKMQDVETLVLNDEVVKNNPEITDTVKVILNNVKSLKVKYKFFEYKYIQLNVFMIVFIQYVYNSMTKFIVDVIAYNQARDAIRQEMTQKIFRATQEIMGASDMELKPQDAEAINRMITNLQDKIKKDQQEIQDMSGKLKNNSLSDLLNFVLTSDENLASHIMEGVDKYKATKSFVVQKPVSQPQQPQQPQQVFQQKPVQQPQQPFVPKPIQQQPITPKPIQQQPQQPITPKPIQQQPQQPQQPQQSQQPKPAFQTNPYDPNKLKNYDKYLNQVPKPVGNVKKSNTNTNSQKAAIGPQAYTRPQTITQAPLPPITPQQLEGGFWRGNSLIPQGQGQQTGGFWRDSSLIPQPFSALNK
jgi:hypothetical protein